MKHAFNSARPPARKTRIDSIINSIFDWEQAAFYGGLRIYMEQRRTMIDGLQQQISIACPTVHDDVVFDLLRELNYRRALPHPREAATETAEAFLAAQDGDSAPLSALKHRLQRRIAFLEKHYDAEAPTVEVPLHILADIMDSDDGMKRIRVQEKLDYVAQKRGRKNGPAPT